jgi:hypothetical protein
VLFRSGKVLLEKFNDGFGISEGFFIDIINFLKSLRKGSFSKGACLRVVVHNFVVENREVKSKSKSDWMSSLQFFSLVLRLLIGVLGIIDNSLSLFSCQKFSKVSEIVTLHLQEKHNGLWMLGVGNQMIIKK